VSYPMDFVAVPAGTLPVAALTLRGADPSLCFATSDFQHDAGCRNLFGASRSRLCSCSHSEAWAAQAARCSARTPLIALSGVTLAAAAASATLSIEAALALSRKLERHRPLAARRVHH